MPPASLTEALILTSPYHVAPIRQVIPETPIAVFTVNDANEALDQIRNLPDGATVGLVSVSSTLLRMATEMIGALRGQALEIIQATAGNQKGLRALVALADLVMTDSVCHGQVARFSHKTVGCFQRIPDSSIRSLIQQMPLEALSLPTAGEITGIGTEMGRLDGGPTSRSTC